MPALAPHNFDSSAGSAHVLLFAERRDLMIRAQLVARGIDDPAVLAAMRAVPRHAFVSDKHVEAAYEDRPLPIGHGATISQPYIVALMTQALALRPQHRVLDVGTGSGYQAAILAQICTGVVTVELTAPLAFAAARTLRSLGLSNVFPVLGDGSHPRFLRGSFDCILVAAAAGHVPPLLLELLAQDGRLVIPVGPSGSQQLLRIRRLGHRFVEQELTPCMFVPLRGAQGPDWGPPT